MSWWRKLLYGEGADLRTIRVEHSTPKLKTSPRTGAVVYGYSAAATGSPSIVIGRGANAEVKSAEIRPPSRYGSETRHR